MGKQWMRLIRSRLGSELVPAFIAAYPITAPDPSNPANAQVCAHAEVWTSFAAVANRAMDGFHLYQTPHIRS